jgi:segregation and condensation protein A
MYRVELKNFEGPLDLLIFFIKKDELDIYDIPIAHITEQFLNYIRLMEELDMDVASEFILMASMLMSIKARMMIPREDNHQEVDEHDPRYELVQRLLEFKKYKEMGFKLKEYAVDAQKFHYRGFREADRAVKQPQKVSTEALRDVTVFDLMTAFKKVLTKIENDSTVFRLEKIEVTIEQQISFTLEKLRRRGRSSFYEICASLQNRIKIIVTFLAVLELLKEQKITLYVEENDARNFYLDLPEENHTPKPAHTA